MLTVKEALDRILPDFHPLEAVEVSIYEALGKVAARPVYSELEFPHFDNSSVDGFAVRAADVRNASRTSPAILKVHADIPAGPGPLVQIGQGEAARIMTGAVVPDGADAVIMVEDTNCADHPAGSPAPQEVLIYAPVREGTSIRRKAADIQKGQNILPAGTILRPQEIGMLAMLGNRKVWIHRRPMAAIISSGDELLAPGARLIPGMIYDSNSTMIEALVKNCGGDSVHSGVARDRLEDVEKVFQWAFEARPDIIISSAGVGTGAFDYIKDVVGRNGRLDFWKVNMRPGKPLAFGNFRGIPFFGLPGNPVSSFVSFMVFVQPALEIMRGNQERERQTVTVVLDEAVESDGRESYLRAIIRRENGRYHARLTGHQGSGNLFSTVQANALVIIPAGETACPAGAEYSAWLL